MLQYQNQNDETLVMLTLAGEQRAYEVLVVRYQRAVISAALSVTKTQFMAEDAAQDAFVTAWMKLNTLNEPDKFGAWVSRIARNCALNMVTRLKSFMSLDALDNTEISGDSKYNPAERYTSSDTDDELYLSIGKLPEKVKQIIYMHYFEGLGVAEIADKMRISSGTVKWQLHDGRKRIRKELCAMNEKWNDTLVQRVMKKVEELKLWQVKNDKTGFEEVYKDVLREVEELPESRDKSYALADVLMRGWWWLPGDKNDALFARIVSAAERGKNEEVMSFIVGREDSRMYKDGALAVIRFIRDKQIPRLEKAGFVKTLGKEWFWLGYMYYKAGKYEEGSRAYDKVYEILGKEDIYHALIPYAHKLAVLFTNSSDNGNYKEKSIKRYLVGASAEEYRYINGQFCFWGREAFKEGHMYSVELGDSDIFRNSSRCDGNFFMSLGVGESYVGSDGTTLTFVSDSEEVKTPAGVFDGCELWVTKNKDVDAGKFVCRSYYKDGVGIVKYEYIFDGEPDVRLLSTYTIVGGSGKLPMAEGNTWEYASTYAPDTMRSELKFTVSYADDKKVLITSWNEMERLSYDENSWLDMIKQIRNDYWDEKGDRNFICDVSHAVERAEALAVTPMEKAHIKAAASVVRRIMDTDPEFNKAHTATGHWNFFAKKNTQKKNGTTSIGKCFRWSFEWKSIGGAADADWPLLCNDIYGILQDAANCIWSDEWRIGASPSIEYTKWDRTVKTKITCEDGGTVTTKAGVFDNCFKLSLDIGGMNGGYSYRGGKKVYYFAEGVGIVRTENEYCGRAKAAVYELSSYEGIGEGYMPLEEGMVRRYDALNLTDGFVGAAEYAYVADEDGDIIIFADRTGIRELPPPITFYGAIQGELIEEKLWEEGKREECRLRHDINNFHLLTHFLARESWYRGAQEKAAAWNKYKLNILENLSADGELPPAWYGYYNRTLFITACTLFGCGKREEGYEYLERAFVTAEENKWAKLPEGSLLSVGDPLIFGGIKLVKGENVIELPDGTREPLMVYYWHFDFKVGNMYYGMTAPRGWEWFNPVRNEEKFKEYVERARKLAEIEAITPADYFAK